MVHLGYRFLHLDILLEVISHCLLRVSTPALHMSTSIGCPYLPSMYLISDDLDPVGSGGNLLVRWARADKLPVSTLRNCLRANIAFLTAVVGLWLRYGN